MKSTPEGQALTRAEIRFRLPDRRNVVGRYIWEDFDQAPEYPKLFAFLANWHEPIEGALQSMQISSRAPIGSARWKNDGGRINLD
jgi:uncharacterized protein Usg